MGEETPTARQHPAGSIPMPRVLARGECRVAGVPAPTSSRGLCTRHRVTGWVPELCHASDKKKYRGRFGVQPSPIQRKMGWRQGESGRIWGFWLKMSPSGVAGRGSTLSSEGSGETGMVLATPRGYRPPKGLTVPISPILPPVALRALLLFGGVSAFLMPPDQVGSYQGARKEGTRRVRTRNAGNPVWDVGVSALFLRQAAKPPAPGSTNTQVLASCRRSPHWRNRG